MTPRTGTTRKGKIVPLGTTTRVPGGWAGYALNAQGVAVEVFVPGADAADVIEEAVRSRPSASNSRRSV